MKCPICGCILENKEKSYECINGHPFDKGKSGYVNLIRNYNYSGDNKEMVNSRFNVLNKGYFNELASKITDCITELDVENILDLGCGEGYYDRFIKNKLDLSITGVDISKDAIIKASKLSNAITYVVANIYDLPFFDNEFDLLLNIFAPINLKEFLRVNSKYLVKVIPDEEHLLELKKQLYENVYLNDIKSNELEGYDLIKEEHLKYRKYVSDVNDLFKMTPYYFTTHNNFDVKLYNNDITFSFIIRIYEKKTIEKEMK